MPWEKQYSEDEALESAARLFWRKGYAAASVSDIVAATGVNRGSLYAAYDGKRGLFMKALKRYDKKYRQDFLAETARRRPPAGAILATFEAAAKGVEGAPEGCLMVNTALEMSPHDPEIADFVKDSLGEVERFFRYMIEAGQGAGDLDENIEAAETASRLLGLFLGLRVMHRSGMPKSARDAVVGQARELIRR